ncbi:hypothetical protein JIX56_07145 [Streptomyces sp. CA-210063]|nr:hypothetical protein [Streptomyces sp. CA-210063]UUU29682.1 hypothetical protein JIX56_07145 [Streptomyces sp. CA-210063]
MAEVGVDNARDASGRWHDPARRQRSGVGSCGVGISGSRFKGSIART